LASYGAAGAADQPEERCWPPLIRAAGRARKGGHRPHTGDGDIRRKLAMSRTRLLLAGAALAISFVAASALPSSAQMAAARPEMTKQVGGAPMYPSKNIIQNAVNSKDHTTLVAAVKAAGLVDTLQTAGPFTVFAPVNMAFDKLPAGTVPTLLKPENKGQLTGVLTYHVVAGRYTSADLARLVKQGGGKAMLKTVQGGQLTIMAAGKGFTVADAKGDVAHVTISDVMQSNGVIQVVDTVLLPG
jgi:uncharacterized surface protein with fasciclin (FAS1) repeats